MVQSSSENKVTNFFLFLVYNCSGTEFKCVSGDQCISSYYQCDGVFDCNDHSDETDCRKYRDAEKLYLLGDAAQNFVHLLCQII